MLHTVVEILVSEEGTGNGRNSRLFWILSTLDDNLKHINTNINGKHSQEVQVFGLFFRGDICPNLVCVFVCRFFFGQNKKERKKIEKLSKII